jgi:hypothetical protein
MTTDYEKMKEQEEQDHWMAVSNWVVFGTVAVSVIAMCIVYVVLK